MVSIPLFFFLSFRNTYVLLPPSSFLLPPSSFRAGDAASDLLGFLVMFAIVFLAHAIMGMVAFGASTDSFHTFGSSLETCSQMLLGDFDFDKAYEANPAVAPIFLFSFVVLVFLTLLNMFTTILGEHYDNAKKRIEDEKNQSDAVAYDVFSLIYQAYESLTVTNVVLMGTL